MKLKRILLTAVGGLALPLATVSAVTSCNYNGGGSSTFTPLVTFEPSQAMKQGTIDSQGSATIVMTGLCTSGFEPTDLDESVITEVKQCEISVQITAKITNIEGKWVTVEVKASNITNEARIIYSLSFKNKATGQIINSDTVFVLNAVAKDEQITDNDVTKVRQNINSIQGSECSVLIKGFTVNGGSEGIQVHAENVTTPATTTEIADAIVVKGDIGTFSVKIVFKNIPTSGETIKFVLKFTDSTNPIWRGFESKDYEFTFVEPTSAAVVSEPANSDYKTETSWTTIGTGDGEDGFKNDINCLFSGFSIALDNPAQDFADLKVKATPSTTKGEWSAAVTRSQYVSPANGLVYFDVYVYGGNIDTSINKVTFDFEFTYGDKTATYTGYTMNIDSEKVFQLELWSRDIKFYSFKVLNTKNSSTYAFTPTSDTITAWNNSLILGYVSYIGQGVVPELAHATFVSEGKEAFPGPMSGFAWDRLSFDNPTPETFKNVTLDFINQNYEHKAFTFDCSGGGIFCLASI